MQFRWAWLPTAAMEALVLFLVAFSAWPFASVHRVSQWVLLTGVSMMLAVWAARLLLEGRVGWVRCPIVACLAVLCMLGMYQVVRLDVDWLAWLSPETTTWQDLTLPGQPELDEAGISAADSGRRTPSFDAGATHATLLQLAAVLALFAVVRNNLRDGGTFYRLAWVSAINGALLAVVGLGQMASSPPNVVFWTYPTDGSVFGPFICRNHFAYYANLCIGLTAGLLLGTRYFLTTAGSDTVPRADDSRWRGILADPRVLWLATCLVLLAAGLLACLSRGGVLSAMVGAAVAGMLLLTRRAAPRWVLGVGVVFAATALVGWFGLDRVTRRWEHLLIDATAEGRLSVWSRTLPLIARYPLTGTGLGTFSVVEPQTREPGDPATIIWDHAHNDYLELAVEGGPFALLTAMMIIALVIYKGVRAFQRYPNNGLGRLALGGLMGFVAVATQSLMDFGLHVPAVMVLLTVVAAMLTNLADAPETIGDALPDVAPVPTGVLSRVGMLVPVGALLVVAVFLVREGQRSTLADRECRLAWATLGEPQVAHLRAAVASAPERADLRLYLTDALVRHVDATVLRSQVMDLVAAGPVTGLHGTITAPAAVNWAAAIGQDGHEIREARAQAVRAQLQCPLNTDTHERLLKLAVRRGSDPTRELERLAKLNPSDPATWYALGRINLKRGCQSAGWRCWQNALRSNAGYVQPIAQAVPDLIRPDELLEHVLPENSGLILSAADAVPAGAWGTASSESFLRKALLLLQDKASQRSADDWLMAARICSRLNDPDTAALSYGEALARSPLSVPWRLEFSEFLYRSERLVEARRELVLVLGQEPGNQVAKGLFERVDRAVAERQ
jgi:O-antigen ligase